MEGFILCFACYLICIEIVATSERSSLLIPVEVTQHMTLALYSRIFQDLT